MEFPWGDYRDEARWDKAASCRFGAEGASDAVSIVGGDADASSGENVSPRSNGWKAMSRKKSNVKRAAPTAAFNV
jgi:hypothetical protein